MLTPEIAATFKIMVANHGLPQKPRPNPLTMPVKRPGHESGLSTPPLSGVQVRAAIDFPFVSLKLGVSVCRKAVFNSFLKILEMYILTFIYSFFYH